MSQIFSGSGRSTACSHSVHCGPGTVNVMVDGRKLRREDVPSGRRCGFIKICHHFIRRLVSVGGDTRARSKFKKLSQRRQTVGTLTSGSKEMIDAPGEPASSYSFTGQPIRVTVYELVGDLPSAGETEVCRDPAPVPRSPLQTER